MFHLLPVWLRDPKRLDTAAWELHCSGWGSGDKQGELGCSGKELWAGCSFSSRGAYRPSAPVSVNALSAAVRTLPGHLALPCPRGNSEAWIALNRCPALKSEDWVLTHLPSTYTALQRSPVLRRGDSGSYQQSASQHLGPRVFLGKETPEVTPTEKCVHHSIL